MTVCKTADPDSLLVQVADGDGMNRQAGARVRAHAGAETGMLETRSVNRFVNRDTAGRVETGEMQKAGDDFTTQVG
jgi:hypothetical protein